MKWLLIVLPTLFIACGPQFVKDPNATVFVTSQYEDGFGNIEIKWVYPWLNPKLCKPQADCKNKDDLSCSIILYNDSLKFMKEGDKLALKKLYLSASVEYLQARSRLYEAEIRLNRAEHANTGFMGKVQKRILECEKKYSLYKNNKIAP